MCRFLTQGSICLGRSAATARIASSVRWFSCPRRQRQRGSRKAGAVLRRRLCGNEALVIVALRSMRKKTENHGRPQYCADCPCRKTTEHLYCENNGCPTVVAHRYDMTSQFVILEESVKRRADRRTGRLQQSDQFLDRLPAGFWHCAEVNPHKNLSNTVQPV